MQKQTCTFVVAFFLCFAHTTAWAQVHIDVGIAGHRGEPVFLYSFDDLLTRQREDLDTAIVDANHHCVFDTPWEKTGLMALRVGQTVVYFYARKGDKLKLHVDLPDTSNSIISGRITYIDPVFEKGGINDAIMSLEDSINDFLSQYYVAILRKAARKSAGRFVDRMMKQFGNETDPYFKDYLTYSMALLRLNAYHNKDSLYAQYLLDKPMRYGNDAWMAFSKQFYMGVLDKLAYDVTVGDMVKDAVIKGNRAKLAGLMNRLPWLENGQIRDFVLITEVYRIFSKKIFPQKALLGLLKSTRDESIIPQHRKIAANAIEKLLFMKEGSTMPALLCRTVKGKSQIYKPDNDSYVYYTFWSAENSMSVSDIEVVEQLAAKYKKWIDFVFICTDEDDEAWLKWLESGRHKGKHLRLKMPEKEMEACNIQSVPAHFLLAPGAKILYTPELAGPQYLGKAAGKIMNGSMKPTWLWRQ